jgi:hypothetical protein
MPNISASTGDFLGSIHTDFGFIDIDKKPELLINGRDTEQQEQNEINRRSPSYVQIRHDRQRKRHTSNIDLL